MSQIFFSDNLKYYRKKHGKNQADIGFMVNKRGTAVSSWESNLSQPSLADVAIIADYFGVSVGDFIGKNMADSEVNSKKTDKKPPMEVKTTNVLLIEDATMLTKMEEDLKQMRAEYDRRLTIVEAKLLGWKEVGNRVNEPTPSKSKVG